MWAKKSYDEKDSIEIHVTDVEWTTIPRAEAIELALDILKTALT